MPKSANIIQFSLSSEYLDRLKLLAQEEESIGLTAKRLLIGILGGDLRSDKPSFSDSRLDDLKERLEAIETAFESLTQAINERFENNQRSFAALADQIAALTPQLQETAIASDEVLDFLESPVKTTKRPPPPPKRAGRKAIGSR